MHDLPRTKRERLALEFSTGLAALLALALLAWSQPALADSPMHLNKTQCWRITGTQGWSELPDTCFLTEVAAATAIVPLFNATWRVDCYIYTFSADRYSFPNGVWPEFTTVQVDGTQWTSWPAPGCGGEPGSSQAPASRFGYIARPDTCPPNSAPDAQLTGAPCRCIADYAANTARDKCYPVITRYRFPEPNACLGGGAGSAPALGNPIMPLSGTKSQTERLGHWLGRPLSIHYDTREKVPSNLPTDFLPGGLPSFGDLWRSNQHRFLKMQRNVFGEVIGVVAHRGGWSAAAFVKQLSGEFSGPPDRQDRLWFDGARWLYRDGIEHAVEAYDGNGRLQQIAMAAGGTLAFEYTSPSPGVHLLTRIADHTGRAVVLEYEQPSGASPRIFRLTPPDGRALNFGYDSRGQLTTVSRAGVTSRTYHYELGQLPWALTGVSIEGGVRRATYGYDASGRATSTEAPLGLDRFAVSYDAPPSWDAQYTIDEVQQVVYRDLGWSLPAGTRATLPDGSSIAYGFSNVNGMARLTSQSQPAGSGCAAATRSASYDAVGNLTQRDDFNGARACFVRDALGREIARIEGLPATTACASVLELGASLPAGAYKASSEWLGAWNKPMRLAGPGRVTTFVYHGQPDPFDGMSVSACASGAPGIPGAEPLTLLCKRVEQATSDSDGAAGFSAPIDGSVATRVWRWTYDAQGRTKTSQGPDGALTSTRYFDASGNGHLAGDPQSITNAMGHVTTFVRHDALGNVLEQIDPNGVTTAYAYDEWQRVTGVTIAGLTRHFSYWGSGPLYRATEPDGSYVEFHYDAAQRLVTILHSDGQRIDYTLDAAGRRVSESATDGAGTLRRQVTRVFDALGRVERLTGRELQP